MNREFLMLAHTYATDRIAGWFVSEKLDGMRCFWDGGITKGMKVSDIAWANSAKDGRYVDIRYASGLWSRYGKPIYAPPSLLEGLPDYPLDGELYAGVGNFQEVISTVKQLEPGDWSRIRYVIFDSPSYREFFRPGKINNPNYKNVIIRTDDLPTDDRVRNFEQTLYKLRMDELGGWAELCEQKQLSSSTALALWELEKMLEMVSDNGGEGLILRKGESYWEPIRSKNMLKVKRLYDAEAVVVGYNWGEGKYAGMMGSLLVEWKGKRFSLSGFTDAERVEGQFPLGSNVTFRYRELTDDGIPKEARYWRRYSAT